jgi:hypothetical protein
MISGNKTYATGYTTTFIGQVTLNGNYFLNGTLKSNLVFNANNTYNIGSTGAYASNLYVTTTNYNSTASMTGATAGSINVNAGSLGILATSNAATHSLTLGSTATGIALYNTSDQTTNYERAVMAWSANVFTIDTENSGTGSGRAITISAKDKLTLQASSSSETFTMDNSAADGYFKLVRSSTIGGANQSVFYLTATFGGNNQSALTLIPTMTNSSGVNYGMKVLPTVNQSGTAGYTALLVNPTQTAVGSGTKLLIDMQVGGTSKLKVDNTGHITAQTGNADSSVGTGTLSAGTVTISTTAVTASSLIFLTDTSNGANLGILSVGTISAATSFVVNSSNTLDSGTFNWFIVN